MENDIHEYNNIYPNFKYSEENLQASIISLLPYI